MGACSSALLLSLSPPWPGTKDCPSSASLRPSPILGSISYKSCDSKSYLWVCEDCTINQKDPGVPLSGSVSSDAQGATGQPVWVAGASGKCELGCSGDYWSTSMDGRCFREVWARTLRGLLVNQYGWPVLPSTARHGLQVLSSVGQLQLPGSVGEEDTVLWAQFVTHRICLGAANLTSSSRPRRRSGKKPLLAGGQWRCSVPLLIAAAEWCCEAPPWTVGVVKGQASL